MSASSDASAEAKPSRVSAKVFCPHCCERIEAPICFRYGEPGTFLLGETVRGENVPRVVADAWVQGPCPACEWDGAWPVEVP